MKIYLYYGNQIYVFNLPEVKSGSYRFDVNEEEVSKLININVKDNQWVLIETEDCKIADAASYLHEIILQENCFYMISRNNKHYLIYVTANDEKNVKAYTFSDHLNLSIGVDNSTLHYNCSYAKNVSFQVTTTENNKFFLKIQSGNIYINRNLLKDSQFILSSGDELELFGVKILFLKNVIIFMVADEIMAINESAAGLRRTSLRTTDNIQTIEIKDKDLYSEEDYFSKAPRFRRVIEKKDIELSQPPSIEKGGELPFLLTVGPMFAMGISSMMMLLGPISQLISGTSDLEQNASMLVMGSVMLITSLILPIISYFYNKRMKKKNAERTKEKYHQYISEKEWELKDETKLQKEIILENVISLNKCLENLQRRKLNFWDKRIDQSDFLVVRVGTGDEKLQVNINYPEEGFSLEEDELKKDLEEMIDRYKYIKNVPLSYSLYENTLTAVMGERNKVYPFVHNILFQLLTFYSYDDLKIVVFTNKNNCSQWDYVKFLNHNMTNDNSFRFFASNEENAVLVCDVLKQEVTNRAQLLEKNDKDKLFRPYYLVIVDDLDIIKQTNFIDEVSELKRNVGFSFIILENKLSKLPSLCNNFINLGENGSGILKNSYEGQEQILFQDEINPNINMMEVAKVLANIPIEISSRDEEESNLPDSITFLEMAKVGRVEQLNIMNRWKTNDSTSNLKAEVGVTPDGKLMYLDLHEKAHGPHGLIAGMTGSGKSEFIITWILSLCMNFSPDDVAFILIDYKGGGLAFAFENKTTGMRLPHLTGTITNLDKAEINRTLVSIDSEVKRRQSIFNDARDKLGESTIDIYKYQSYYHEGKLQEPLPHLFIVCDEFAELKAQQPDFMDNLISVARIGRSLGVHLILATQKPSGVVNDQIWSNTKFRVCLKVQDESDSKEMLKKPDAASLKQTGRFYLQVGYDEYFALGQSGWCGAKYYPSDILQKSVDKSVNILDETGITLKSIQSGISKAKQGDAEGEQLAAIMKEIVRVATESNKFAKRLWLENIPNDITIEETEKKYQFQYQEGNFDLLLGEVDAPEKQEQYPLIYNLITDGNLNIVGLDSQESESLVNSILYNIMRHFAPKQINYYVIDYGSQNFTKYKKAAHCGGVVSPGDTEQYHNLWKLVIEEQKTRKTILSDFGGDYLSYVKQNPDTMPLMVVVMHNFESISESDSTLYDFFAECIRDSERYGIIYIITSSSVNGIPDRYRQLISSSIAFKLKEISDYGFLFNNIRKKIEPRNIFGRGVCKDDDLHEFQLAFITKDLMQENSAILNLIDETTAKFEEKAKRIPSLPEQVTLEYVQNRIKDIQKVPVGIEKGTLKVKSIDLTIDIGKLILTSKLKYTKFFISSLLDEILIMKKNLIVIDPNKILEEKKSKIVNYFTDNLEEKLTKIESFIEGQKEKENIILIYSATTVNDKLGGSTQLASLFDKSATAGNTHIIIVDETKKIKDCAYDGWFKKVDVSDNVFIGPGVDEQNVFRINGYGKELSEKRPYNFGYYISEGFYYIIKLIEFEKMEELDDDEE